MDTFSSLRSLSLTVADEHWFPLRSLFESLFRCFVYDDCVFAASGWLGDIVLDYWDVSFRVAAADDDDDDDDDDHNIFFLIGFFLGDDQRIPDPNDWEATKASQKPGIKTRWVISHHLCLQNGISYSCKTPCKMWRWGLICWLVWVGLVGMVFGKQKGQHILCRISFFESMIRFLEWRTFNKTRISAS